MASTLYGARLFESPKDETNAEYPALGANSEAFTQYDIVSVSGQATNKTLGVAQATSTVVGIAFKTQTMTSTNVTVAKVVPGVLVVDEFNKFLMYTNSDLTSTLVDYAKFYKITGATGAQLVDTNSGVQTTTSRVVQIIEVDPYNVGGTGAGSGLRQVVVRFVKTEVANPR